MPVGRLSGGFGRRFTSTGANRRSTMTLDWSIVQCGMPFCESWLCKLALVSLSFIIFFVNLLPLRLSLYLSLSVCLSVSLSTYLSLSQSWCLSLSRCIKNKKREKRGERKKIFFLYGGTSGLHAHMHGHAWLGVVCCWHVAVEMLYVAMVSSLFISVSQSPTSRCGLPSK